MGYCALGDVTDTNTETLPANTPPSTRFRYIDLSAVAVGLINWGEVTETTFGAAPSRARRVVKALNVLFGTVRPNLKSHGFIGPDEPGPLIASTGFSVVCGRDGVSHPGYLFHSLMSNHVTAQAVRSAIGSSYPALNDSDVRRLEIFLPSYGEQQGVAYVLDTLDSAIHATEAIIAKLKAVKQGLLHDLLTRGIAANGELRPPQAEAPHLYKASPLGWIPKEWDATDLGVVTDWASGGTPNRATQSNWIGDVPFLTPKDMKAFELADTSEHISLKATSASSRLMPPDTVFIVVRGMILAHSFPVVLASRAMAFNQDVKAVSCGPHLSGRFLAHWFVANSDHFLRKVTEATHGTKKLDMENLLGMPIGVPPLSEQAEIVARQSAVADRLNQEALSLSGLNAVKSALMDDLLTGRVRVSPLLTAEHPQKSA